MSDKKLFCITILMMIATLSISIIFFSGRLNPFINKIPYEASAYMGSLTSLTLIVSFVTWRNDIKYQSENIYRVKFYVVLWIIFSSMNIVSIGITVFAVWYKLNLNLWYLGFSTFTIMGVFWFSLLYWNGLKLDNWPILLTKKVGFYKKVIKKEINKNVDYEAHILKYLSGHIKIENFENIKKNIDQNDIKLSNEFYRKLFEEANSNDKKYVINLSFELSWEIRQIINLNVEWIEKNYKTNEQFIYQCLNTYPVKVIFTDKIEKIINSKIETENSLINFALNFVGELKEIISMIQNKWLTIAMILQHVHVICSKYKVTAIQIKNIEHLFLGYSKSLKNDFHSEIIEVVLKTYNNKEERDKQLKKLLLSQER